jgi:hypothetical protein
MKKFHKCEFRCLLLKTGKKQGERNFTLRKRRALLEMYLRACPPLFTSHRLHRRNLALPLPAFALAAVKFGGAAILKKVALSKVMQKVGPDKILGELRALNNQLRLSGVPYGAKVADASEESLNVLERSLTNLKGDERVGALWTWYSTLEKKNPSLAAAVLKTWLETLPGMKWASVLMSKGSGSSASGSSSTGSDTSSSSSSSSAEAASRMDASDEASVRASSVLEAIRKTHPDVFKEYYVVLIPREDESV